MFKKMFEKFFSKGHKSKKTLNSLWDKAIQGRAVNISLIARELYLMVLDIETIGEIGSHIPYDIGITIVSSVKTMVYTISYIISEIFDNEDLMKSAYYKEKISFYKAKLKTDSAYVKKSVKDTIFELGELFKKYQIPVYFAYNGGFDRQGLINLYDTYIKSEYNPFRNIKVVDIMFVASYVILGNYEIYEEYMYFCYTNGFITPSGKNIKFSAESVFAFLMNRPIFNENHTGLEDTYCEKDLLLMLAFYFEYKYGKDLVINCLEENKTTSLLRYTIKGGALNIDKAKDIASKMRFQENKEKGFFNRVIAD